MRVYLSLGVRWRRVGVVEVPGGRARSREAELRLGTVPRGPQGSGEAAREAVPALVDGFLASALTYNFHHTVSYLIPSLLSTRRTHLCT